MSKVKEADALFEQALELNQYPFDASTYFNKALSLHGLKKHEEALVYYEKAVKCDPNDAFTFNNIGILLKTLRRFNDACQAYDKAIQLEPKYAYAYK